MKINYIKILSIAILFIISTNYACKKSNSNNNTINTDVCTFSNNFVDVNVPMSDTGAAVISSFINFVPQGIYLDSIYAKNVVSTIDSQITASGQFKSCQCKNITLNQIRVTIDSPANMNFNFIDSINLYMAHKNGSGQILVAKKGGIPLGTKQVILDIIPNNNLRDYVIVDSFRIKIGATKSNQPVANTTDKTYFRFDAGFTTRIYTD